MRLEFFVQESSADPTSERVNQEARRTQQLGTATGVEPPEGALTSLVDRLYKTKNKSKTNQSTGTDAGKLQDQDNTHSSKTRECSRLLAMFTCVLQGTMPYIHNRMHTCCSVFAFANSGLCCTFVITARRSISKGMGVHRELSQWMIIIKANTLTDVLYAGFV
jgi:hypothetical protein